MSISLNLVIYKKKESKLIETDLITVRCAEISQNLLNLITDEFPMKNEKVYFDEELKNSFDIEVFDNTDIEKIINKLKLYFRKLLEHEYNELIAKNTNNIERDVSVENYIIDIIPDETNHNPTELAIARFRILTDIIGIFMDKQTKLSSEIGAIIKLG